MLVSSVLGPMIMGAAALTAVQGDPTRGPRDAFTRCLFAYADKAVQDRTSAADFDRDFAQQCQQQERAFRDAIRASAGRMPAAEVEEIQNMEVEDARANTKARYEDATAPRT